MSEIKDLYSPELDNTHLGMYYIIYKIVKDILNNYLN